MQRALFDDPAPPLALRPYQAQAVDAVYRWLAERDDNPCVVIPTGGGKTPVMAQIASDAVLQWGGRVLVLAHVKELLEQSAKSLARLAPRVPVGVYSAGLGRKDRRQPVTVAGIQSIYRQALDLDPFDLVLVDEAHLIPPDGEGMYRQFLADAKIANPRQRVIGFTATAFRLKSGPICGPDNFLHGVCYEVGVRELIVGGYLSPLVSKAAIARVDTTGLALRGGEFVADEAARLFDVPELVRDACQEISGYAADRNSVLIFGTGIEHCRHIAAALDALGQRCEIVTGETPGGERDRLLREFTSGQLKYLANVNVLTTGFDAPGVDCVALLRPTMSAGLYYQMVGRGFRLSPETGKQNCLVLDFGGNVERHGPVDRLEVLAGRPPGAAGEAPAKECPKCHSLIAAGFAVCPDCGHEFPPPERQAHDATASAAGVLSGQVTTSRRLVELVSYSVHAKRGEPDAPKSLRVDYVLAGGLFTKSEWICFEHAGYARQKAERWWQARSASPVPASAQEACDYCAQFGIAEPSEITIRQVAGERFDRVVGYALSRGDAAEPTDTELMAAEAGNEWDDIPF